MNSVLDQTPAPAVDEPPPDKCSDIERFISLLHPNGELFEIRVILARGEIRAGTFVKADKAAREIARVESQHQPQGIYITINPLRSGSPTNRIRKARKTARNEDIACIRCILIDIDVPRPSKTSATDSQVQAALTKAEEIREWLKQAGFAAPLVGMSGNGAYLVIRVDDQPIDQSSTVRKFLRVLKERFDDETAEVDGSVHNPARILKVLGTVACKGESTAETPHRRSWFEGPGSPLEPTPFAAFEAIVANASVEPDMLANRPSELGPADSLDRLRSAMEAIPGSEVDSYGDWVRLGIAAKQAGADAADPDALLQAWIDLSSRSAKFKSVDDCRKKWAQLDPNGSLGGGTIIHLAQRQGWRPGKSPITTPTGSGTPIEPGSVWIADSPAIPLVRIEIVDAEPKHYRITIPSVSSTGAVLPEFPVTAARFEKVYFAASNKPPPLALLTRDNWRAACRRAMEEAVLVRAMPEECVYAAAAGILLQRLRRQTIEVGDRDHEEYGEGTSTTRPLCPLSPMWSNGPVVLCDRSGGFYFRIHAFLDQVKFDSGLSPDITKKVMARMLQAVGSKASRRYCHTPRSETEVAQYRVWAVPPETQTRVEALAEGDVSFSELLASGGGDQ